MTRQGHTLSAWITFSAFETAGVTVAQAQALEPPSDPFDEIAYLLGGNRRNDRFWETTPTALARDVGVADQQVATQRVGVGRHRQWRFVRNLRHSATIDSAIATPTSPIRRVVRRRSR